MIQLGIIPRSFPQIGATAQVVPGSINASEIRNVPQMQTILLTAKALQLLLHVDVNDANFHQAYLTSCPSHRHWKMQIK